MSIKKKLFWVAILYFMEGFPLGFIYDFLPVYLREYSISLKEIGLLSLIGLPWTLKFLWAPTLDLWGERRHWIMACLLGLSLVFFALPFVSLTPISLMIWLLFLSIPLCSATQDIAIDAYTIELMGQKEMGRANGVRVTCYRIALMSLGGFLAIAGWLGWRGAFIVAAILMVSLAGVSWLAKDQFTGRVRIQNNQAIGQRLKEVSLGALQIFFRRPGFLLVMLFIMLFKLGDMAMGPMIKPFWVDRGFTPAQIGMISVTLGVAMTTLGALIGGFLTDRLGIFHSLWILGLTQAGSNLVYAWAASIETSVPLIYTASIVESFTAGLGTGPFLAFLMSICDKQHAATQYALLSALFGLTRSISGTFSGFAAESFGYASYFLLTFGLAFPAFALLPWVKRWTTPEVESMTPSDSK